MHPQISAGLLDRRIAAPQNPLDFFMRMER
jgi:hypothetical protein